MATQKEKLRQQIAVVIRSKGINRINFTLDGITIDSSNYFRLARAVLRDNVHVEIKPLPDGIGAKYNRVENMLTVPKFPYGFDPKEQSTITHEITHAIVDMFKIRTNTVTNECIAHTASAMFHIASKFAFTTKSKPHIAAIVAESILEGGRSILRSTDADVDKLRKEILNSPTYIEHGGDLITVFTLDGIPGA
ncbi:MAG: hypothetical protein EOP23_04120 [Hyphomicrobiales bacterium]|nr:MAG: hypothetical protein EOP23_04120 [Hyphomicrobiales bacterium]